jgi:hypothetical protein
LKRKEEMVVVEEGVRVMRVRRVRRWESARLLLVDGRECKKKKRMMMSVREGSRRRTKTKGTRNERGVAKDTKGRELDG